MSASTIPVAAGDVPESVATSRTAGAVTTPSLGVAPRPTVWRWVAYDAATWATVALMFAVQSWGRGSGPFLRVLAADPADPAALVCADVHEGVPSDLAALRAFSRGCSAVTFDHEQVPQENLRALVDAGVPDRGHRSISVFAAYREVGVACWPHPVYRVLCVSDFSGSLMHR